MLTGKRASDPLMTRLAAYDTPTVCNAIELFDIRPRNQGYMDGRIRCCFPEFPPMVGYAATVQFGADAIPSGGRAAYDWMADQAEGFANLPGPPVLVFQDLDDPPVAATFGEVMCTAYQRFGGAGLITSGGGRDIDQVREIGFPAFVGSTISAHGYCHFKQIGVPVRVGGITVNPGDLLHGDVNGVTTIPSEIASEVPDTCAELAEAEKLVLDYMKSDAPTPAGLRQAGEAMRQRLHAISVRLRIRK